MDLSIRPGLVTRVYIGDQPLRREGSGAVGVFVGGWMILVCCGFVSIGFRATEPVMPVGLALFSVVASGPPVLLWLVQLRPSVRFTPGVFVIRDIVTTVRIGHGSLRESYVSNSGDLIVETVDGRVFAPFAMRRPPKVRDAGCADRSERGARRFAIAGELNRLAAASSAAGRRDEDRGMTAHAAANTDVVVARPVVMRVVLIATVALVVTGVLAILVGAAMATWSPV